ncbi:hypothetical protein JCM8097_007437 [Rhodosporidiobolus ruineniae]
MTVAETHYDVLNLPRDASSEAVRVSYLALKPEATQAFARLAAAYTALSDPQRRKTYDASLAPQALVRFAPPPARPPSPAHSAFHAPPTPYPPPPRHPPSPASSPFPGYRVPPGGYPHAHPRRPPPRRPSFSAPRPPPPSFAPPPDPFADFASPRGAEYLTPLEAFDPFSVFERVMALQQQLFSGGGGGGYGDGADYLSDNAYAPGGGGDLYGAQPYRPFHPSNSHRPRPRVPTRRASTTTSDLSKHRNGDFEARARSEEVEQRADGTVRVRRVETRVEFSSGRPRRPHSPSHHFPPPFPPHHHKPHHLPRPYDRDPLLLTDSYGTDARDPLLLGDREIEAELADLAIEEERRKGYPGGYGRGGGGYAHKKHHSLDYPAYGGHHHHHHHSKPHLPLPLPPPPAQYPCPPSPAHPPHGLPYPPFPPKHHHHGHYGGYGSGGGYHYERPKAICPPPSPGGSSLFGGAGGGGGGYDGREKLGVGMRRRASGEW